MSSSPQYPLRVKTGHFPRRKNVSSDRSHGLVGIYRLGWVALALLIGIFSMPLAAVAAPPATATFAGGCFWCMEAPFDSIDGVLDTTSGYTGGDIPNPSYGQVSGGGTGHVEAVQVTYDPAQVSYEELLPVFWHNVDPVDQRGQFCDKGSQYRSAIFYSDAAEAEAAEQSKQGIAAQLNQAVTTDIRPAAPFYPAEDYHQDYYLTHPVRYKVYRFGCGRDQRLAQLWGDSADH